MRVRVNIIIETTTLVVIRDGAVRRMWCPHCGGDADMVALGDISGLPQTGQLALERWLAASRVHRIEHSTGDWFVCLASLLAGVGPPQPGSVSRTLPNCGSHVSGAEPDDQERS